MCELAGGFITEMESVYRAVRTGDLNRAVCVWAIKVFITEMESVYSAVRTGDLNKAVCAWVLKGFYNRDGKCLQRGTDWGFK
jgi:hypothetical protein